MNASKNNLRVAHSVSSHRAQIAPMDLVNDEILRYLIALKWISYKDTMEGATVSFSQWSDIGDPQDEIDLRAELDSNGTAFVDEFIVFNAMRIAEVNAYNIHLDHIEEKWQVYSLLPEGDAAQTALAAKYSSDPNSWYPGISNFTSVINDLYTYIAIIEDGLDDVLVIMNNIRAKILQYLANVGNEPQQHDAALEIISNIDMINSIFQSLQLTTLTYNHPGKHDIYITRTIEYYMMKHPGERMP